MHSLVVYPCLPWGRLRAAGFSIMLGCTVACAPAAVLTSSDGKQREFPVVVAATPDGLTVRDSPTTRDIVIPWSRLDLAKSAAANPWLDAARAQAVAGESVVLNLGLAQPEAEKPAGTGSADAAPEWRTSKITVTGGPGKNFSSLSLSAYIHREVAVPRLAVVWVGPPSPLAKRGDAADWVRRMQGALVVADFEGAFHLAGDGSGQALISGVADLLRQARIAPVVAAAAPSVAAEAPVANGDTADSTAPSGADPEEATTAGDGPVAPALVVMGRGEAATFVWSLVCTRPQEVVAAVMIDGMHRAEPTAGAFTTPCLFLRSPGPATATTAAAAVDLTQPEALWRHYSTDGNRWCFAAPTGDPLALAVAFGRDVATASPYLEALEMRESWQSNKLRHRIPMPVLTAKDYKPEAFRLATPDGATVFPVASKTGAARNDLVWVPSAAFAARLTGR